MAQLPENVARSALRGLSAFLKATPAQELPAKLRPIRSFAPKALAPHRKMLLATLDDDSFRPRVAEWLHEKQHPLSRADAETLRLLSERPDGWEEELRGEPQAVKATRPSHDPELAASKALEREKEKARKARDEARKAREEAAAVVRAERERSTALALEVKTLQAALKEARAEADRAGRKAKQQEVENERIQRRVRKDVEKNDTTLEKLRRELKDARRDLRTVTARIESLEAKKTVAKSPARRKTAPVARGPRKPLPYVPGLLDDDPRTLDSWLGANGVLLLVDGYNVTKSEGGFGDLELPKQRQRLVQTVNALARKKKVKATIVFDGSNVPPGSARLAKGPAVVEYSRADEIADDHLVALLEKFPPHPVIVVTDDKELRGRSAALGATVAGSKQLLALIR
jgi:predicted RNA-binding protein with PIN domain